MPHKHKRKRNNPNDSIDNDADFDLPPEKRARPLDVRPAVKKNASYKENFEGFGDDAAVAAAEGGRGEGKDHMRNKRRKPQVKDQRNGDKSKKATTSASSRTKAGRADDDTPKQFARMMAWQAQLKEKKKKVTTTTKTSTTTQSTTETQAQPQLQHSVETSASKPTDHAPAAATTTTTTTSTDPEQPKQSLTIQQGESLSSFAQRVNRSLPLSGIPKSQAPARLSNNNDDGKTKMKMQVPKDPLTRHNKHLQRMQSEWRNAETKLQARRDEADEDRAELREEDALLWMDVVAARNSRKGKRKKGGNDEEDVWKVLEKRRRQQQQQQNGGKAAAVTAAMTISVAGLTASKSVQAPLPQSTVRQLDVERVKRMFRGVE